MEPLSPVMRPRRGFKSRGARSQNQAGSLSASDVRENRHDTVLQDKGVLARYEVTLQEPEARSFAGGKESRRI